jgi:GNAT superfamily N-acetyltransferase
MLITVRDVTPADYGFLREVYASTREEELALVPWDNDQREAFLKFQFDAQDSYYRSKFCGAAYQIILNDGERVGRLYVDRDNDGIRILDVTVLPQFRSVGIGSYLVKQIVDEAMSTGQPVTIWIEHFNPSQKLFRRFGFAMIQEDGYNQLLEFRPSVKDQAMIS